MSAEIKLSKAETRKYLTDKVAGVEESLKRIALISRIGSGVDKPSKESSDGDEPKRRSPENPNQ